MVPSTVTWSMLPLQPCSVLCSSEGDYMSAYRWRQNPEGHARENVFFFLAEDENAGKVNQLNTKLINGMVMISGVEHL